MGKSHCGTCLDDERPMALKARLDWIEIPVANMERAAAFYGRLFETELEVVEKISGMRAAFLPTPRGAPSSPVATLMEGTAFVPAGYQGCRLYFQAEPTMEAFLARVEEAGGVIEVPPLKTGSAKGQGLLALFFDTEGNLLGVHGE